MDERLARAHVGRVLARYGLLEALDDCLFFLRFLEVSKAQSNGNVLCPFSRHSVHLLLLLLVLFPYLGLTVFPVPLRPTISVMDLPKVMVACSKICQRRRFVLRSWSSLCPRETSERPRKRGKERTQKKPPLTAVSGG